MATATYDKIATTTLGSAASSITFSSIPGTYTDLKFVLTGTTASAADLAIQYNTDTGTNYSGTFLSGTGSAANSTTNGPSASNILLQSQGASSTTIPAMSAVDVFSYAGATYKTCLIIASTDQNGAGAVETGVGLWRSTAAITSIKIFGNGGVNLSTGTTATLYGIKAA
jgi:hypothetical protein